METLWQDARYAARVLRRSPGFAAIAILTLALGIALNTAAFSVVNAFLLRPLPFQKPDELVHIWTTDVTKQGLESQLRVSVPNFADWSEQNTVFAQLGGYYYQDFNVTTEEEPFRVQVGWVTPRLLVLLGTKPALGRTFLPEEGQAGRGQVVVLSHGYWQRHFASDPKVLGQTVTLDASPYTVVGVMPPEFVFPLKATQLWRPLPLDPATAPRELGGPLLVVGRLKPGVTLEQAQAEMSTIARRLEEQYPQANKARGARVIPLRQALLFFYDEIRLAFLTLSLAVAFVLFIICANLGNLLLTRAIGRTREVAVRAALGASRLRLVRQFLTESALLALAGGVVGALAAEWTVGLLGPLLPEDLYRVGEISLDARVLVFTAGAALLSAAFFGLVPALQVTQPDLSLALKEGERGGSGSARTRRLRGLLVVLEISLATVLLAGSALMVQTFLRLQSVELGFNAKNVLTLEMILPQSKYPGDAEENLFYDEVLRRVKALPGVEAAATVYPLPLNFETLDVTFALEGREPAAPEEKLSADRFWVTPDYFRTMGIPLVKRRGFDEQDRAGAPGVVVINRKMVERFWPNEDPLGRRLRLEPASANERLVTVVGVVGDSKHFLLNEPRAALVYFPQLQDSTRRRFLTVRTAGEPMSLLPSVRQEIRAVDSNLPLTAIRDLKQVVSESLVLWSGPSALLGALGLGALVLAAMGICGVLSYSVSQRTHEIGIRMALGAKPADIMRLILRQGAALTGLGLAVGLALALALTRLMQALLFGVSALDPLTFLGTPLVLAAVALAASYVPARRATRVDPMVALRYE